MLLCHVDNAVVAEYRRRGLQFQLDHAAHKSEDIPDSHHSTFTEADLLHRAEIGAMHSFDIRAGAYNI